MCDEDTSAFIQTSGDFYRCLCECGAMALVATDANFRIVCWNDAADKMLGKRSKDMLGKPLHQAVPQNRHKLLDKLLERTTTRREATRFEIALPAQDAQICVLMVILSPIIDDKDKIEGVAAWIIDDTHRKRLTERLSQTEKLASLGTLAGGVAHHFNNILGGVGTFVDYALTSGDPVAMKRALQMTAEAANRAGKITQSLLAFAEPDRRRGDLADITEIVMTFSHLVEAPLKEKNIKLTLELNTVPVVPVKRHHMHRVLGNLLANAEEAMPDGGEIRLTLDRQGREIRLSFADTGRGIPTQYQPLVFEPFFTTKGTLAGGEQSNPGLGLSVVHGLLVEMGARVRVESEQDKGATFRLFFPIPDDTRQAEK